MSEETQKTKSSSLQGINDLMSGVDQKEILVMDLGSRWIRLGFSGQNMPELCLRSRIAKPRMDSREIGSAKLPKIGGMDILNHLSGKEKTYTLEYPIVNHVQSIKNSYQKLSGVQTGQSKKKVDDGSVEEPNKVEPQSDTSQGDLKDDLEFFIKQIIERDLGVESLGLDTMITFNKGILFLMFYYLRTRLFNSRNDLISSLNQSTQFRDFL